MPAVSVILPFRNAEATLRDAIGSISAQTLSDWELICFDDGSTDTSGAIAREYAAEDARIRVIGPERVGIVAALARACAEAAGTFLARMDADDIAHRDRLARQIALMQSDDGLVLCGALVRATGDELGEGGQRYYDWLNQLVSHDEIVRELFIECPVAHPTFFMRRDAYRDVGGYQDHGWAEDYDLMFRFWQAGGRFAKVPEVLLGWRHSAGRMSLTDPRYSLEQFRRLKRHYLEATVLCGFAQGAERRQLVQWGAGEVGKRWLREWGAVRPRAVIDIHPRKIGTRIHRVPVLGPDDLPAPSESFILVAVGAPGARDEIRSWLSEHGHVELRDYIFIA